MFFIFKDINDRLGISIYPDHGRDPSLLIRLADKAKYDAKQVGRSITVYTVPGSVDHSAMRNFLRPKA